MAILRAMFRILSAFNGRADFFSAVSSGAPDKPSNILIGHKTQFSFIKSFRYGEEVPEKKNDRESVEYLKIIPRFKDLGFVIDGKGGR